MISHEFELTLHRLLEIASLMERGQLTEPRKMGRELRLLAMNLADAAKVSARDPS